MTKASKLTRIIVFLLLSGWLIFSARNCFKKIDTPPPTPEQVIADSIPNLPDGRLQEREGDIPAEDSVIFSKATGYTMKSIPCEIDTVRGILIWHGGDHYNSGDTWDHGYWVGKCGPYSLPLDSLTFIPGIVRRTVGECLDTACERVVYHEEAYPQQGTFYSASWKIVPADRVYGLIVLRDFKKKSN